MTTKNPVRRTFAVVAALLGACYEGDPPPQPPGPVGEWEGVAASGNDWYVSLDYEGWDYAGYYSTTDSTVMPRVGTAWGEYHHSGLSFFVVFGETDCRYQSYITLNSMVGAVTCRPLMPDSLTLHRTEGPWE